MLLSRHDVAAAAGVELPEQIRRISELSQAQNGIYDFGKVHTQPHGTAQGPDTEGRLVYTR